MEIDDFPNDSSRRSGELYRFRINSISTSAGTKFMPADLTILIGPNNSGKSTLLKEIRSEILGHADKMGLMPNHVRPVASSRIEFVLPSEFDEFDAALRIEDSVYETENGYRVGDYCNCGIDIDPVGNISHIRPSNTLGEKWRDSLQGYYSAMLKNDYQQQCDFFEFVGPLLVDYLGTDDRLILTVGEPARGILDQDYNMLSSLCDKDFTLESISRIVMEAFDRDVILDDRTSRQTIVPRTSSDFSELRKRLRGDLGDGDSAGNALKKLSESTPMREEGDGLRSFAAVMMFLMASSKPVLLIDEPESFLHPPQARLLGKAIVNSLSEEKGIRQTIIATHSTQLLQGIMDANHDIDIEIVRIERILDKTQSLAVDPELLRELMTEAYFTPRYFDALFSFGAVLVESPSDIVVYEALLRKFGLGDKEIFVPLNGKHLASKVYDFYKKIGLPCKLILDFDFFNDYDRTKKLCKMLSDGGDMPELSCVKGLIAAMGNGLDFRSGDKKEIEKEKEEFKKRFKNVAQSEFYREDIKAKVNELIDWMALRGAFVLRTGQLESILQPDIQYRSNKNTWRDEALKYISNCPCEDLMKNQIIAEIVKLINGRS